MKKMIQIFGGGTFNPIAAHLALAAPAFGSLARQIAVECARQSRTLDWDIHLTKMADPISSIVTNEHLEEAVNTVIKDPLTKIIFFTCAVCDFEPIKAVSFGSLSNMKWRYEFGPKQDRFETSNKNLDIHFEAAPKIVANIRAKRKDIFLVACKTTCGASKQDMFLKGLDLCKRASVNLVLVNDILTKENMIVTPEEAVYHEGETRQEVIHHLVEMALLRSHLTFTRSTVVDGKPVAWNDPRVPESLRKVVDYCVSGHAYKTFRGSTVGHFACKLSDTEFLTSIRRSNFNKLDETGLVYVKTDGPDTVLAYGAKPSVGGQSQRTVFRDHPGMDCIVHFHSPLRENHRDDIPVRSQREVECGSHECGQNTSSGLAQFGNLKAVYLTQHGPNIVFNKDIDPNEVIEFIEANFRLDLKTGGYKL